MSNEGNNLEPWTDPVLEARIVAMILGESSDYEKAELDEAIAADPELASVHHHLSSVHELLAASESEQPMPAEEQAGWKLSPARRSAVLEAITSDAQASGEEQLTTATNGASDRTSQWRRFAAVAAVFIVIGGIIRVIGTPASMKTTNSEMAFSQLAVSESRYSSGSKSDSPADIGTGKDHWSWESRIDGREGKKALFTWDDENGERWKDATPSDEDPSDRDFGGDADNLSANTNNYPEAGKPAWAKHTSATGDVDRELAKQPAGLFSGERDEAKPVGGEVTTYDFSDSSRVFAGGGTVDTTPSSGYTFAPPTVTGGRRFDIDAIKPKKLDTLLRDEDGDDDREARLATGTQMLTDGSESMKTPPPPRRENLGRAKGRSSVSGPIAARPAPATTPAPTPEKGAAAAAEVANFDANTPFSLGTENSAGFDSKRAFRGVELGENLKRQDGPTSASQHAANTRGLALNQPQATPDDASLALKSDIGLGIAGDMASTPAHYFKRLAPAQNEATLNLALADPSREGEENIEGFGQRGEDDGKLKLNRKGLGKGSGSIAKHKFAERLEQVEQLEQQLEQLEDAEDAEFLDLNKNALDRKEFQPEDGPGGNGFGIGGGAGGGGFGNGQLAGDLLKGSKPANALEPVLEPAKPEQLFRQSSQSERGNESTLKRSGLRRDIDEQREKFDKAGLAMSDNLEKNGKADPASEGKWKSEMKEMRELESTLGDERRSGQSKPADFSGRLQEKLQKGISSGENRDIIPSVPGMPIPQTDRMKPPSPDYPLPKAKLGSGAVIERSSTESWNLAPNDLLDSRLEEMDGNSIVDFSEEQPAWIRDEVKYGDESFLPSAGSNLSKQSKKKGEKARLGEDRKHLGYLDAKGDDEQAQSLREEPQYELEKERIEAPATKESGAVEDRYDRIVEEDKVAPSPELFDLEKLTTDEPFSTFSLSVSDVSFKLAKSALLDKGSWPEPTKIRPEEFVNAFDYGDPSPNLDERVACAIEQCAHPFLQQRNLLRISMKTAAVGRAASQPLRLTVLLDKSGSMEREDREASVAKAFDALASQLGENDVISVIGFARTPSLIADRLPGARAKELAALVAAAPSEGGTNLEEALRLAEESATRQFLDGAQNRIVLITDGAANLGDAEPDSLQQRIIGLRGRGIAFDACGVGADGLNDEILEALARKGDGRYYFLDKPEDADEGFVRQLAGALRPAARNVKVQVKFNPQRVARYRLSGFEKHRLNKEDFRNDKVDAAEIAAAEAGNALYQIEVDPAGRGDIGEVFVRFQDTATGEMVEHSWPISYQPNAARLTEATPSMQLAATAGLLGEKLRGGPAGEAVDLSELAATGTALRNGPFGQIERVLQLVQMIEKARTLGN